MSSFDVYETSAFRCYVQPVQFFNRLFSYMYFINTYIYLPTIMYASMDGTNLKTLIGMGLHQPSGLTIDYNMDGRIFWTDTYQGIIESSKFDGTDRTTIIAADTGQ